MALKKINPEQGEIWLFDPDPIRGVEIGKKIRPALILSCNALNKGPSGVAIIVPLTSKDKKIFSHVRIEPPEGGLTVPSFAVCEQIRAITKQRLVKKLGKIQDQSVLCQVHSWINDLIWIS